MCDDTPGCDVEETTFEDGPTTWSGSVAITPTLEVCEGCGEVLARV